MDQCIRLSLASVKTMLYLSLYKSNRNETVTRTKQRKYSMGPLKTTNTRYHLKHLLLTESLLI